MTKEEQVTLRDIYDEITKLRLEMQDTYVSKDRFKPVERIAYGLVALIVIAVVGAMLSVVIRNPSVVNAITTSKQE